MKCRLGKGLLPRRISAGIVTISTDSLKGEGLWRFDAKAYGVIRKAIFLHIVLIRLFGSTV